MPELNPLDLLYQSLTRMRPLPEEEWEWVKPKFRRVSFQKKERIIDTETVSNSYVFIASGLARLYGHKEGEEKTLFFFKEGMFAGSIQSFLFEKPSFLILQALEDIEGLEIAREDLDAMFDHAPTLSRIMMTYTQFRLSGLLHYFSSFVLDSPEERYEKFMMAEPDLINRVPQRIIASFLGVTPVSLSRIRKRLSDKRAT